MYSPTNSNDAEFWNNWISTPTFDLSPFEKPDMSPYLIHMTGRNAIKSILAGDDPAKLQGHIKACRPESGSTKDYDAKVVCFTESPTFTLDFFRRRSKSRWDKNQRFGIGFSKSALVDQGVRPALYMDRKLQSLFFQFRKRIMILPEKELEEKYSKTKAMIEKIYPLMTPLLEDTARQGFTWEREWRFPFQEGFRFEHSTVSLVCCPSAEVGSIKEQLDPEIREKVVIVNSWLEYDEVVAHLKLLETRKAARAHVVAGGPHTQDNQLASLKKAIKDYDQALNRIDTFESIVKHWESLLATAAKEISTLRATRESMARRLQDLQQQAATTKVNKQ